MLNDDEMPPSEEQIFIAEPDTDFLLVLFEMFRISVTVFELFAAKSI
jgi:hypothetical protein